MGVFEASAVTLADVLQFVHVASAFVFVGGLIGRDLVLWRARSSTDIAQVQSLTSAAGPFDRFMVIPGSFAVVVFGVLTWWAQGLPLWSDGTRWVPVSLLLFASTAPLVPAIFLPRGKVFENAMARAIADGRVTEELTVAFHDPLVAFARWFEAGVVAVVILLMVTKPF